MNYSMSREPSGRQYINYAFYKLTNDWYQLSSLKRKNIAQKLTTILTKYDKKLTLNLYSTLGVRAECDLMLWRVSDSLEIFEDMTIEMLNSGIGPYLNTIYSFLSMTKHSQYVSKNKNIDQEGTRIKINPKKEKISNRISLC